MPQPPLTQQHFSHLARLVRYIEPRHRSAYAFAIGNLSRDDTQYEAGHGAVALIFGLRIRGAHDHAGRQDPPFCHAVVAVDRHLDAALIYAASAAFYRRLLPDQESQAEGSGWYHTYVRYADNPDALEPLLRAYVADFDMLPAPGQSQLGPRWVTPEGATPPKRVVIVYPDQEPFENIAACAARIAGVLVESDVRWTAISSGREADLPGGISVRFVPASEATTAETAEAMVLRLEDVPVEAEAIAGQLFAVKSAQAAEARESRGTWRQRVESEAAAEEIPVEIDLGTQSGVLAPETSRGAVTGGARSGGGVAPVGVVGQPREQVSAAAMGGPARAGSESAAKSRLQVGVLVALGVVLAIAGVVAAILLGTHGSGGEEGVAATGSVATESAAMGGAAAEVPKEAAKAAPTAAASAAASSQVAAVQKPASTASSPSRMVVRGVHSAGLTRTALPAASAGANPHDAMVIGKFHGVIRMHGPTGCLVTMMRLPPSPVVVWSPPMRTASSANQRKNSAP